MGEGFRLVENLAPPEAELPGEQVVHRETDAVKRLGDEVVRRDHEAHVVDELRGVTAQETALAQGFADEVDVALRQVAHAAVNELGRAGRRTLGKIVRFEQERAKAPRRGVDGGAETGRAAADDDEVPGSGVTQDGEETSAVGGEFF